MKINNFFLFIIIIILINSCSKERIEKSTIKEKSLDLQVLEAYREGIKSLKGGDVLFAAKKFNEVEILFPQSVWAPKSALMAAYSYYSQDYYGDAVAELERFIRVYPFHKDLDYAYYLLSISYYEQIIDEKKDLDSIMKAKINFTHVINKFPNTEYAMDSRFKIDLIDDMLASKEMYLGRYYFNKKKWIPSINRFRKIVDDYENTIYVEEALHRLVEVNYLIGLEDEAKKYAKLLGYNYQSSEWYENSYSLFNKKYKKRKIKKKKTSKVLNKLKSLLELNE